MGSTDLLEPTRGPLLIVGGAEDTSGACVILRELVRLGGGASAHIAVVTAASQFPLQVGERYVDVLTRLGAGRVQAVHIRDRSEADRPEVRRSIQDASAVYFTGGIQSRIAELIGGTGLQATLHRRWRAGLVVGGTSAGAAAMSEVMIVGSPGPLHARPLDVVLGNGLGFIPQIIVDQHFSERRRLMRLLKAVGSHPDRLGVGIDEDTAVVMHEGRGEVIGRGAATLVDARGVTRRGTSTPVPGRDRVGASCVLLTRVAAGRRFSMRRPVSLPSGTDLG